MIFYGQKPRVFSFVYKSVCIPLKIEYADNIAPC